MPHSPRLSLEIALSWRATAPRVAYRWGDAFLGAGNPHTGTDAHGLSTSRRQDSSGKASQSLGSLRGGLGPPSRLLPSPISLAILCLPFPALPCHGIRILRALHNTFISPSSFSESASSETQSLTLPNLSFHLHCVWVEATTFSHLVYCTNLPVMSLLLLWALLCPFFSQPSVIF